MYSNNSEQEASIPSFQAIEKAVTYRCDFMDRTWQLLFYNRNNGNRNLLKK